MARCFEHSRVVVQRVTPCVAIAAYRALLGVTGHVGGMPFVHVLDVESSFHGMIY